MSWSRSSLDLTTLLDEALADSGCERLMLFGGPAYALNGHVIAAVHRGTVAVRLPVCDLERACEESGGRVLEPQGGGSGSFLLLPAAVSHDSSSLSYWLVRGVDHARSLPPRPRHA